MSQAPSPSTGQPYGLARVCRVWGVARSTVYWQRHERATLSGRRGPLGPCTDDELVDYIRRIWSMFGMRVIFPCWGSVQQSSRIWKVNLYFEAFQKQPLMFQSGRPLSGHS